MTKIEQTAKLAEQGGSAVAVGSYGAMQWMNDNYQAVAALCAIGGFAIALAGFFVGWYYKHKQHSK